MSEHQHPEAQRRSLRYRAGDTVRIVRGPDRGRIGVIVSINPASARPYLVKFSAHWYMHFADDRLSPAPNSSHSFQHDAAASSQEFSMPRDILGYCRHCGAPDDPCRCASAHEGLEPELTTAICDLCHGDGFCNGCAGDGRVLVRALGTSAMCPDCGGSGNCIDCDGTGRMPAE